MKNISVKTRIMILLTMLMAVLAGLLMIFVLIISSTVSTNTAKEQLTLTVRNNLQYVEAADRSPNIQSGFQYYYHGVSTLIYSKNETLLAGQIPVSFTADEDFQNGVLRTVSVGDTEYLVLDMWLPSTWENGIWLRGLMEAPDSQELIQNLLRIALVTLPLFILLAALGSYHIARRAFRPLEHITATAEAINEAKDLSGRIGLPPGRDEFSRLAEDFDHMFERLERSFEAEKQFTADASHELRTPVAIIKGACEYAEKYDETSEDHQETISMIHRQADKMADLISQLLSMTRMEQGTEHTNMEPLDLGELVRSVCQESGWDIDRLSLDIEPDITVQADPDLMCRLIRNLVENGFKYGIPDGHVWVSVSRKEKEILFSVKDNGIGIPKDEQEKIWKRFYQVDSARSGESGAGLGLAMVQQIARIHGGYMTLESTPGKGSEFILHL